METDAKYYAKTTKSALALDINDENAYNNKKMCLGETQFEKNRNILLFWQVKESMGKIRKLRNHNIIRYSISILLILAMMLGLTCSVETPSAVDAATLNGTAVANLWKANENRNIASLENTTEATIFPSVKNTVESEATIKV